MIVFSAGKTALHWAAAVNNSKAAQTLLQNGANRDAQDTKVSTANLTKTMILLIRKFIHKCTNEKFMIIFTIFCRMKLHYFWQQEKGVVIQPKSYWTTMPTVTSQITWTGYLET